MIENIIIHVSILLSFSIIFVIVGTVISDVISNDSELIKGIFNSLKKKILKHRKIVIK